MAPTPAEAEAIILSQVTPFPVERVVLRDCAGRILREDIQAERDNPPFDRVCMDGVAIASAAFADGARSFRIEATQAAGAVPLKLASPAGAIEAMTGAVLPHDTDCVIPVEEYDLADGMLILKGDATAEPWRNIQRRGSDSKSGTPMLTAGMKLGAAEVAVVASAGRAEVAVSREPRIIVISTGDELIEPGKPIADHQIRRSNAYGVVAALRLNGYQHVHDEHVRDDEALMKRRIGELLETHDVLVLSGGVSKGKFDFVPATLAALGVTEKFHQVAQRPGRPMWFGVGPRGQLVFGLPGNPVSTLVCLLRYVLPALRSGVGWLPVPRERVRLLEPSGSRKMSYFMPVSLQPAAKELALASIRPPSGSGDFLTLAGTDGFVELPPRGDGYPAGFEATLYRW
ncbi:MAG: molybdopterin molybdotransferase MoeA [Pseudomonadota bacterium]